MLPEDRLDTLLSLRVAMRRGRSEQSPTYGAGEAGAFQPLLDAADRVAELGDKEPSRDFVAHLEALFLARAAYLRERDGAAPLPLMHDETALPILDPPPFLGHDAPTLPSIEWAAARDDTTEARTMPRWRPNRVAQRQTVWRRLLWPALAAMLLLAIGMSTLTAAAAAGPGSPLYGLRRWEQNIQLTFAGSAADRVRLHITYAQDALSALDATVASRQTGATYEDALATFRDEARAAMTNLNSVPAGGERDALSSQLQRLLAHGTTTLHSALAMLQWPQRIEATGVLGEIGDNVLIVTQASMVYAEHGQRLWTITVTG
ncbi:MAG TPA: hypothetical protein VJR48_14265, partial [Ktedonobacterales bacterium]|nr:hypothetical protein [Ktedonobacterales bacterium]